MGTKKKATAQTTAQTKEKRANLLMRILAMTVRICTIILFILAGLATILLIALPLADMTLFSGFFTGQVLNLLIQTAQLQELFTLAQWISDHLILMSIIMVVALVIVLLFKRALKKIIRDSRRRPTRAIIASIINLIANLALLVYTMIFIFNLVVVSYVNNYFNLLNGGTQIQIERMGYSNKVALVRTHLDERDITVTQEIQTIMDGVTSKMINSLDDEEYRELALEVVRLINKRGSMPSADEHYFRNMFSRAPATLDDMIDTILYDEEDAYQWTLLPPDSSVFHMYGPDGEFNLKFTSADGYFEAVYNKNGELLTEHNDPANMGTFNYAGAYSSSEKHTMYDVLPYFVWSNVQDGPSPADGEIGDYYNNPDAQNWYEYHNKLLNRQAA